MGAVQRMLIDGYNVIYADEMLRRTACRNLQRARETLLDSIAAYIGSRHIQVTVVFDGRQGIADGESVIPGKLQVMFSAADETADEVIVGMLRRSAQPQSFIVVSSDMAHIGRTAKAMGCQVIGAKRFLDRLSGDADASRKTRGGQRRDEIGNVDYWLERFEAADDEES